MNKKLLQLVGIVLGLESLYAFVFFFPLIQRSLILAYEIPIGYLYIVLIISGVLLLLISGIGLILYKRWSITTLWISLAFTFIVSMTIGSTWPPYVNGGFQMWFVDLIIAILASFMLRQPNNIIKGNK